MGADVIKVEPPGRGAWERNWAGAETYMNGVSAFFMLANRNLRSITLNLKSERGAEAARLLAARSDVLIENYRPGVLERLGLGYGRIREGNQRLFYASGSGYGSDGPYSHLPGQTRLFRPMSGPGATPATSMAGRTLAAGGTVDRTTAARLAR